MVDWDSLVTFSLGGAAIIGFLLLLYRLFLKNPVQEVRNFCRWIKKFQRDWDGEPAGPGRSQIPGVMERLNRIDGELSRNGGSSLKDQVFATNEALGELSSRVDHMESQQLRLQKAVETHLPLDSKV
jgi:hypothetical protein